MNEFVKFNKKDSAGDVWCEKYKKYVHYQTNYLAEDTLLQLEKNYETAFDEIPSADDMKKALQFIALFCAEIGETCYADSQKAWAASEIRSLIDEDDPILTANNIAYHRS